MEVVDLLESRINNREKARLTIRNNISAFHTAVLKGGVDLNTSYRKFLFPTFYLWF